MADDNECKVYVGSLSFNTENENLEEFFKVCGEVVNGKLKIYFVSLAMASRMQRKIFSF